MSASHSRAADSTSVSNTGLQIEGRTADDLEHLGRRGLLLDQRSPVRSSLSRRVFSMAMTAWAAKF